MWPFGGGVFIAPMSCSMASRPKSFCPPLERRYASSTNSTPPAASSMTFCVFGAVWPMCSPTRLLRWTSTSLSDCRTPTFISSLPMIRAKLVFPVPGLPWKIMWYFAAPRTAWPSCRRFWSRSTDRWNFRIWSFRSSSPIIPCSSWSSQASVPPKNTFSSSKFTVKSPSESISSKHITSRGSLFSSQSLCSSSCCRPTFPESDGSRRRQMARNSSSGTTAGSVALVVLLSLRLPASLPPSRSRKRRTSSKRTNWSLPATLS
mmetsp:Transcript_11474/g.36699  ORF Transcript_11474/g.36699 Transcript_11474/m.36699 type:complete len:261 (+) Transcript_11474:903-1685(+)